MRVVSETVCGFDKYQILEFVRAISIPVLNLYPIF